MGPRRPRRKIKILRVPPPFPSLVAVFRADFFYVNSVFLVVNPENAAPRAEKSWRGGPPPLRGVGSDEICLNENAREYSRQFSCINHHILKHDVWSPMRLQRGAEFINRARICVSTAEKQRLQFRLPNHISNLRGFRDTLRSSLCIVTMNLTSSTD